MAHGRQGHRPSAALVARPSAALSRTGRRPARIDARARNGVPDPARGGRPADPRRSAPGA
ncbi:hypothetical protein [Streptomyces peucetius]|uniref:Uncharacterized protein n=1 Tax=Streptomyces peucetius TaxID=1950 RepID=A0ABY6IEC3_STRPE|nr:hypothetical protein [Streptomyces peucetius]UYQ65226.1 hypothetical protein OGH68_29690 [Streptomyces peucetius]